MEFKAVLFDVIGTTVRESDPGTIMNCFEKAFRDHQIPFDHDLIITNRGKDKMEMIGMVLKKHNLPLSSAADVYNSFSSNVANHLSNFVADEAADSIFSYLKGQGVKVGLGTGLSKDLFEKIFNHLKWASGSFDYIGISPEIGHSRPHPAMILDMMSKLKISDARTFLKVGDTVSDIEEGKNAGVRTAAILAGTQSPEALEKAKPDFILSSLSDMKRILCH
jgi:phosphonatase-like hydrolase